MTTTQRAIIALTALLITTTAAHAQGWTTDDYDPQDWVEGPRLELTTGEVKVEVGLDRGRATVSQLGSPGTISTRLGAARLRYLRLAFERAEDEQVYDATPLVVWYACDDEPSFIYTYAFAARDLERQLREIGEALTTPPGTYEGFALVRQAEEHAGVVSIGFDGSGTSLTYSLGEQTWTLPTPELSFEDRTSLRTAVSRLEQHDDAHTELLAPSMQGQGLELRLGEQARTFSFALDDGVTLPAGATHLAYSLQQRLTATYQARERTLRGVVRVGQIVCEGLTVTAKAPLSHLLAGMEDEWVVVQALVQDGEWGVALYLLAHEEGSGMLPIQGPGSARDLLQAMPEGIRPPNLAVESMQDEDPEWEVDVLDLNWTSPQFEALMGYAIDPQPSSGLTGFFKD